MRTPELRNENEDFSARRVSVSPTIICEVAQSREFRVPSPAPTVLDSSADSTDNQNAAAANSL
eukprot:5072169-Lingulodinium_polyedra.AAC.1